MREHIDTPLILAAWEMALGQRLHQHGGQGRLFFIGHFHPGLTWQVQHHPSRRAAPAPPPPPATAPLSRPGPPTSDI